MGRRVSRVAGSPLSSGPSNQRSRWVLHEGWLGTVQYKSVSGIMRLRGIILLAAGVCGLGLQGIGGGGGGLQVCGVQRSACPRAHDWGCFEAKLWGKPIGSCTVWFWR